MHVQLCVYRILHVCIYVYELCMHVCSGESIVHTARLRKSLLIFFRYTLSVKDQQSYIKPFKKRRGHTVFGSERTVLIYPCTISTTGKFHILNKPIKNNTVRTQTRMYTNSRTWKCVLRVCVRVCVWARAFV